MRALFLIGGVSLILSACAAPEYEAAPMSRQQREYAACRAAAGPMLASVNTIFGAAMAQKTIDNCMEAKGYRRTN